MPVAGDKLSVRFRFFFHRSNLLRLAGATAVCFETFPRLSSSFLLPPSLLLETRGRFVRNSADTRGPILPEAWACTREKLIAYCRWQAAYYFKPLCTALWLSASPSLSLSLSCAWLVILGRGTAGTVINTSYDDVSSTVGCYISSRSEWARPQDEYFVIIERQTACVMKG